MKKIKLNLQISEVSHISGTEISSPLYIPDIMTINVSANQVASRVYHAINKELLQKGSYGSLLKFEAFKPQGCEINLDKIFPLLIRISIKLLNFFYY